MGSYIKQHSSYIFVYLFTVKGQPQTLTLANLHSFHGNKILSELSLRWSNASEWRFLGIDVVQLIHAYSKPL